MGSDLFLIYWVESTFVPVYAVKENEVQIHSFFTSTLYGMNGQLHTPTALPPRKNPVILWIRGYVGLTASLDVSDKKSHTLAGNQTTALAQYPRHVIIFVSALFSSTCNCSSF